MQLPFFYRFLGCALLPVILLGAGCGVKKGRMEDKLHGTWEMMNFLDPVEITKDKWRFEKPDKEGIGKLQWLQSNQNGTPDTLMSTGEYSIEIKLSKTFLHIANFNPSNFSWAGSWQIVKLNKDVLIIALDEKTGMFEIEFARVN